MTTTTNLNDGWLFCQQGLTCSEVARLPDNALSRVDIPHTWNGLDGQDGGDNYHRGLCWYKKTFDGTGVADKAATYLEFLAANSVANVYLNGSHLGEHRGGYSAFRFDISDSVAAGENVLLVGVDNSLKEDVYPLFADFTFYGGIYRDVNLITAGSVHFDMMDLGSPGIYLAQRSVTAERAELTVLALVRAVTGADVECRVSLLDAGGTVVVAAATSGRIDGHGELTTELSLDNPTLWDGRRNPYLYNCRIDLVVNGELADSSSVPTGLRFFEFDGDRGFILNGIPTRLNGVSRHQDRETVGNALTPGHQIEDMELIKEVGANSIRLAHYQHNRFFYELCDREGMVVWAEIPYISRTSETDLKATNAISQMRELIRQNYNHASICMWGVQNELGMFSDDRLLVEVVREMHAVAKEEDPTRPTTQAQVMMIDEVHPANCETDVVAFNQYHGWYVGDTSGYETFIERFRAANPGKPMGYSEYGAEGILSWHSEDPKVKDYTEEYHAKYHEEVMATFNRYPFIWGTYVWNMFDFGSDLRDEGGVQGRNNKGLVTFDRSTKKDAFYFYQSIWSDVPMLHICSKRFVDRHQDRIRVKVYANRGPVIMKHNGIVVSAAQVHGTIHAFDIDLKEGANEILAQAGALLDKAMFRKVAKPNPYYILPAEEAKKGIMDFETGANVQNWFDDAAAEAAAAEKPLEFPEGRYSIKDSIKALITNPATMAIMEENFGEMLKDKRLKMAMKLPFEMIINFKPDAFPKALVATINARLNTIKKEDA